jgi:hypothetical protein
MTADISHIVTALRAITEELSVVAGERPPPAPTPSERDANLAYARAMVALRKRRSLFHPDHFFGEPCWDMLLDLFIARNEDKPVTVTQICGASRIPYGTALRYLAKLEADGDAVRVADDRDQRRVSLRISDAAFERMADCLADMRDQCDRMGLAA